MMTSLVFSLLRDMKLNAKELHSRKPPLYRARISEEFKDATQAILVTSDVSARGLNYPDVTLVIQVMINRFFLYMFPTSSCSGFVAL